MHLFKPILLIGRFLVDLIQLYLLILLERMNPANSRYVLERSMKAIVKMLVPSCLEDCEALNMLSEGLVADNAIHMRASPVVINLEIVGVTLV